MTEGGGKLSQDGRTGQLTTSLAGETLVLRSFSGTEGLGELFEFYVDALSETIEIDFDPGISEPCSIKLQIDSGGTRYFNGILTRGQRVGMAETYYHYRLVMRPWLWLLGYRHDCRFFLQMNVKAIIEDVFVKAGFANGKDFEFHTFESYDTIDYCVQYKESDLAFVMRLMEEWGIYFYFEHRSDGKHVLMLADSLSSHNPIAELKKGLPFVTRTVGGRYTEQCFESWTADRRFRSGKVTFNDYDYLNPPKRLRLNQDGTEAYARSNFEIYDYPGRYVEEERGKHLVKVRLQAEQSLDHRRFLSGYAPSVFSGALVTTRDIVDGQNTPLGNENSSYLVVRAGHQYGTQHYISGNAGGTGEESYSGTYEFQQIDRPFRMLPATPKPRISGLQTAKVVGKKGEENEEISTDEHGRIFVQFFWDRDKKTSIPIRVSQAWAGNRWGEIFIPRVGMEVIVEYLEGDPDRPLVTGCVYNGTNKVPYTLPDEKTKAGWKSDSTKGHNGYNEIYFEDKKKSEVINVHAQKDLNVTVLNDETRSVGADMSTTIDNSETHTVGQGFKTPTGKSSRTTTIKHGDDQLDVETGAILHTAKMKIVLKVGPSTVTIDPTGITLDAPTITIKAAALCTIQGLPVKIN